MYWLNQKRSRLWTIEQWRVVKRTCGLYMRALAAACAQAEHCLRAFTFFLWNYNGIGRLRRHSKPSATRAAVAIRGTSRRPRPRRAARPWLGQCAQGYTDNRNILRMNERNADRRKHILGRTLLSSLVLEFSICEWKFHLFTCKCTMCRRLYRNTDNINILWMNKWNAYWRKHILGRTDTQCWFEANLEQIGSKFYSTKRPVRAAVDQMVFDFQLNCRVVPYFRK